MGKKSEAEEKAENDAAADKQVPAGGYKKGGKVKKSVKAEGKSSPKRLDRGGSAKFIQKAIKHPGALHKELHVPSGEKIPEKKLNKAAHSSNPTLKKRAVLAKTLKGMH